jgi:N-acetylmuramoyl-L-alanine amidase/Stage II sporulation protein
MWNDRFKKINEKYPDTRSYVSVQRTDSDRRLVWPIKKTRQVNKIVIHHTAENMDKEATDLVYMRDIYKYHALTRGWGDIGYNYIIGQRGTIYEWRAGGSYTEWAHVLGNNDGSVGISVMGNFEKYHLNADQENGLKSAIAYFAARYGITLSRDVDSIRSCKSGNCHMLNTYSTKSLIGHRDLEATACPGTHIYSKISGWITELDQWYSPVYNNNSLSIEPIPLIEQVNRTIRVDVPAPVTSMSQWSSQIKLRPSPSVVSESIDIRLSYSGTQIDLQTAGMRIPMARIGKKKIPMSRDTIVNIILQWDKALIVKVWDKEYRTAQFSLESDVVRIVSWSRIPAWDTAKKYNDNLFRGRITVSNNWWQLLTVNTLPVEDYLKWLGEVSNTDLTEKIKTIIVAARSYALYYTSPKNRKYNTNLYDGSDNPDEFQKYLGYSYELRSPEVSRIVDVTRGEIITHLGIAIKPWYFSSSDGRTRSYLEYCQTNNPGKTDCQDIAYLQSTDDPAWVGKVRLGHGVGISGIGATFAASQGKTYKEIIQYYLKWVEIIKK